MQFDVFSMYFRCIFDVNLSLNFINEMIMRCISMQFDAIRYIFDVFSMHFRCNSMYFRCNSMYFRCIFDDQKCTKKRPKIGQKSFKNRSKIAQKSLKNCPQNYIELHRNARKSNSLATKKACV